MSYHGAIDMPLVDMPPTDQLETMEWLEIGSVETYPCVNDIQPATDESDGLEPDPRRDERRLMQAQL